MKPTKKDCADFFECSEDTIDRHIKSETGLTFSEFRESGMAYTKFTLIRRAIVMAKKGDTSMMIFCLKNIAGWKNNDMDGASIIFPSSIGFSDPEEK